MVRNWEIEDLKMAEYLHAHCLHEDKDLYELAKILYNWRINKDENNYVQPLKNVV